MNNSMNILRRLMAFLLALLLVTTMVGDDFYAIAEEEAVVEAEGGGEVAAAPATESSGGEYTAPVDVARATEAAVEQPAEQPVDTGAADVPADTPAEIPEETPTLTPDAAAEVIDALDGVVGDVIGDVPNIDNETSDATNETTNGNTEENNNSDNSQEVNNNANNTPVDIENNGSEEEITTDGADNNPEEITETPEEELEEDTEEETEEDEEKDECDHQWTYVSNSDGTHTKICELCGETENEACSMEDGTCTKCGYHEEVEDECLHEEYEYISNKDGTHIKRCVNCGEETIEECEFDADGICIYCGYEEEDEGYELVYTRISKTIDGVVITVKGYMPENATVDIQPVSEDYTENLLDALGEIDRTVFRAYDITIYDPDGNVYQPQNDGGAVEITVSGISELNDAEEEKIEVLRIEDNNTVTTLDSTVEGDEVVFESEHFTIVAITETGSESYVEVSGSDTIATSTQIGTITGYRKIDNFEFDVYLSTGKYEFDATLYRDLDSVDNPIGTSSSQIVGTLHEEITSSAAGWYTVSFTDLSELTNRYMGSDTVYSVVVEFSRNARLKVNVGNTNNLFIGGERQTASGKTKAFTVITSDVDELNDIAGIKVASTKYDDKLSTSYATNFTGTLCYLKSDSSDMLTVKLKDNDGNENISRTVNWESSSTSVADFSGNSTTTGMSVTLSLKGTGTTTITATYNSSRYATITVYVLEPLLDTKSVSTYESTAEYKGSAYAYTPAVTFTDISGLSYTVGKSSYSNNVNAGTATITVPVTVGSNTYEYEINFTIKKRALTYATFSSDTSNFYIDINTDTNTVNRVDGATSGIAGVSIYKDTDYTITVTYKSQSASGYVYTVTLSEGTSGNYSFDSGNTGEYTFAASGKTLSDYVKVEWNAGAKKVYTYTGSAIEPLSSLTASNWDSKTFTFTNVSDDSEATWITFDNLNISYENNTNVSTTSAPAYIVFSLKSGYSGTVKLKFTVDAANMENVTASITDEDGGTDKLGTYGNPWYTNKTGTVTDITPATMTHDDGTGQQVSNLTITYNGNSLSSTTDYAVTYSYPNDGIGTATMVLTGKGNYSGTKSIKFDIMPSFTADLKVAIDDTDNVASNSNSWVSGYEAEFTNSPIKPGVVQVKLGTLTLSEKPSSDSSIGYYILRYDDTGDTTSNSQTTVDNALVAPGTKYVIIGGTGAYAGQYVAVKYEVTKANIRKATFAFTSTDFSKSYTGTDVEFTSSDYTFTYNGYSLVNGTDYKITYLNNINASNGAIYTCTALSTSPYFTADTVKSGTFTINKVNITTCSFLLDDNDPSTGLEYAYTGSAITPTVTVKLGTVTIAEENYSVAYTDNTAIGTASVTITGTKNFNSTPTKTLSFTITKRSITDSNIKYTLDGCTAVYNSSASRWECPEYNPTYTGVEMYPTVRLYNGSVSTANLIATTNYKISEIGGNTNVSDTCYMKIAGKGSYSGEVTIYFSIAPRSITASTVAITYDEDVTYESEGTVHCPTFTIKETSSDLLTNPYTLLKDTDYTVTADSRATKAGDNDGEHYTATIEGTGNYTGTVTKLYNVGHSISNASVILKNPFTGVTYSDVSGVFQIPYMGQNYPTPTVTVAGTVIHTDEENVEGYTTTDYKYSYERSNKDSTKYPDYYNSYNGANVITITMTGKNGYYGTYSYSYKILPIDISSSDVKFTDTQATVDGYLPWKGQNTSYDITSSLTGTYTITATVAGKTNFVENLVYYDGSNNGDYTLSPTELTGTPGTDQTVRITGRTAGKGNYKEQQSFGYHITNGELGEISITTKSGGIVYKDESVSPAVYWVYYRSDATTSPITINNYITVTSKNGGVTLTEGVDYELATTNNTAIGTATITATGINNYAPVTSGSYTSTSTLTTTFEIRAIDVAQLEVEMGGSYKYTGAQIKPGDVVVSYGGETLTENTDYTIAYGTNTYPGTELSRDDNYITITGLGKFDSGTTKKVEFNIYLDLGNVVATISDSDPSTDIELLSEDGLAKVELSKKWYEIGSTPADTPTAKVYYKKSSTEWVQIDKDIPNTPQSNYKVTYPTDPGPGNVVITGLMGDGYNFVKNTATFKNVGFKILLTDSNVSTYFNLRKTEFAYTGSAISTVENYLDAVSIGVKGVDYSVSDTTDQGVTVGTKGLTITAISTSSYFTGSGLLPYYVKYDLSTASIQLSNSDATYIRVEDGILYYTTSYTGTKYVPVFTVTCAGTSITDLIGYTCLSDLTSTASHTLTLSAKSGVTDVMNGPRTVILTIKGRDIGAAQDVKFVKVVGDHSQDVDTLADITYDGNKHTPTVAVKYYSGDSAYLKEGQDYEISWVNNQNVTTTPGSSTYVLITGKGAYTGTYKKYFNIVKANLSTCTIEVNEDEAIYAGFGVSVEPTFTVYDANHKQVDASEYEIDTTAGHNGWNNNSSGATEYLKSKDPSAAKPNVTIKAVSGGNYSGTLTGEFEIGYLNLNSADVSISPTSYEYTGGSIDLKDIISLKVNGAPLYYDESTNPEQDYQITISGQSGTAVTERRTYIVTIGGIHSCQGSVLIENPHFEITARSIPVNYKADPQVITFVVSDVENIGDIPETIEVWDKGVAAAASSTDPRGVKLTEYDSATGLGDYTVEVFNNTTAAAGETDPTTKEATDDSPYVLITGMNNYMDSVKIPFNVGEDLSKLKIAYDIDPDFVTKEFTYNGVSQTPTITNVKIVDDAGTVLKELAEYDETTGEGDYKLSFTDANGNNDTVSAGDKLFIITGVGNYFGSVSGDYRINARKILGSITWTNSYVYGTDVAGTDTYDQSNQDITLALTDTGMKQLSVTEAYTIYGDSSLAKYYYEIYDKHDVEPTITLYDNGLHKDASKVIDPSDYEVTFHQNTKYVDPTTNEYSALPYVEVQFPDSGNYKGSTSTIRAYFIIGQNTIEDGAFQVAFKETGGTDYTADFTGAELTPEIEVSSSATTVLEEGKDYNVYYSDQLLTDTSTASLVAAAESPAIWPGMGYVYVEGIGSYKGVVRRDFTITAKMSQTTFMGYNWEDTGDKIPDQFMTGEVVEPKFQVGLYNAAKTEYVQLEKDVDYYVNVDTDNQEVTITAKSTYFKGSRTGTYKVSFDKDLVEITNYEVSYSYTGRDIIPEFETNYPNIHVITDDTVFYRRTYNSNGSYTDEPTDNLSDVGLIRAVCHWKVDDKTGDEYEDYADAIYEITPRNISECKVILANSQRYTGKYLKPRFTIYLKAPNIDGTYGTYSLVKDTDYTALHGPTDTGYLSGTGTVIITGTNNFTGTTTENYSIDLWPVVNLEVTDYSQNSITVTWTRDIYAEGTVLTLEKMDENGNYIAVPQYDNIKVEGKTNTYTFEGLEGSSKYRVLAKGYNGSVFSADDTQVDQATKINTSSFEITSESEGSITITMPSQGNITMYYIYRDDNNTSKADDTLVAVIPKTGSGNTGYTNTGLVSGKTYYYYVQGYYLNSSNTLELVSESDYMSQAPL